VVEASSRLETHLLEKGTPRGPPRGQQGGTEMITTYTQAQYSTDAGSVLVLGCLDGETDQQAVERHQRL